MRAPSPTVTVTPGGDPCPRGAGPPRGQSTRSFGTPLPAPIGSPRSTSQSSESKGGRSRRRARGRTGPGPRPQSWAGSDHSGSS
eukprot:551954-Hanusia_phi.AAC.1